MKLIKKALKILFLLIVITTTVFVSLGYLGHKDVTGKSSVETEVKKIETIEHYVALEDMSTNIKDALVAIEDRRFFDHGGVDYYALARSIVVNIRKEGKQGGSTLTQQLAKNMYYMDDNSGLRKISEAFTAREIESKYDKDKILELYLNTVYFGDGYYGIYEASVGYFQVEPKDLSLAQASMIAGMPQAPSVYMLSNKDERSYERQKQVLNSMLELEMISKKEYEEALQEKLASYN